MSTLKEQIAAIITPLQLSAVATLADGKPWVRYVMTVGRDDLNVRFATYAGSRKVAQIAANPEVHLTLGVSDPANMTPYLQIRGWRVSPPKLRSATASGARCWPTISAAQMIRTTEW